MKEFLMRQSEQLKQIPACPENFEVRRPLLLKMDRIFSMPDSENSASLRDFYIERCREAIAEIRTYQGDAPRLWKFYSSGVIVKSSGRAVMFDLTSGCECPTCQTRLMLPGDVLQDFVNILDTGFITHGHADHMGLDLIRRMLRAGKRIVIPADAIRDFSLDGAIPSDEYHEDGLRIIPLFQKFLTDRGMASICNAVYYYAPQSGAGILLKGDAYDGPATREIFRVLQNEKLPLAWALISPFFQTEPDPVKLAADLGAAFIPLHEWEFSHRPVGTAGKATQDYAELCRLFEPYRTVILSWGESIVL